MPTADNLAAAGIKPGSRIEMPSVGIAVTCNQLVKIESFTIGMVGGQLQANAQVTPVNAGDGVVSMAVAATNGTGTTYAGANFVASGPNGTPGETITVFAFSDIFDPKLYGTTILGVIQGILATSTGTCFFSTVQSFDIGS
jgi:hypothetical protein